MFRIWFRVLYDWKCCRWLTLTTFYPKLMRMSSASHSNRVVKWLMVSLVLIVHQRLQLTKTSVKWRKWCSKINIITWKSLSRELNISHEIMFVVNDQLFRHDIPQIEHILSTKHNIRRIWHQLSFPYFRNCTCCFVDSVSRRLGATTTNSQKELKAIPEVVYKKRMDDWVTYWHIYFASDGVYFEGNKINLDKE